MKEVVIDASRRLVFQDGAEPEPGPDEAIISVRSISLNRGEVRLSRKLHPVGYRAGWDLAGVVERAAPSGKGPKEGERVVAITGYDGRPGAWAERVAIHVDALAVLPASVSFATAACLPVAGLTALLTLDKRGSLLGRRVLVTGATGGVGHLAVQLASAAGAETVAAVRSESQTGYASNLGATRAVVVGDDPALAAASGPYDLILDSIGGASASASINMLNERGVLVMFGATESATTQFDLQKFYFAGGASVYGFVIFNEITRAETAAAGFARLLPLVEQERVRPDIGLEASWSEIDRVADELTDRKFAGKAVLHL